MAIQLRRGAYADFDPQKMKPAEVAVVQEDDPTSHDGKAVYVAISPGDVKRMAVLDELQDEVYNQIDTAISTATQAAVATATQAAAESASEAAASADAAAESARTLTIDSTLTKAGQAADAKITGDKIEGVKSELADLTTVEEPTNYAVISQEYLWGIPEDMTIDIENGEITFSYPYASGNKGMFGIWFDNLENGVTYNISFDLISGGLNANSNYIRIVSLYSSFSHKSNIATFSKDENHYTCTFVADLAGTSAYNALSLDMVRSISTTATLGNFKLIKSGDAKRTIINNAVIENLTENSFGNAVIEKLNDNISNNTKVAYSDFNLIDMSKVVGKYYIDPATGLPHATGSNMVVTDYIAVNPGDVYYFENVIYGYYSFYSNNNPESYLSGKNFQDNRKNWYVKIPENANFARFTLNNDVLNNAWMSTKNAEPSNKNIRAFEKDTLSYYDDPSNPCDYNGKDITIFHKILCIGDSLTQGVCNYTENGQTVSNVAFSNYSYPTYLGKITGCEVTNKGSAGRTTAQWYSYFADADLSGYDCAIINLGVNDALTNHEWTQEESDALDNIIAKLKAENTNIKIFVSTIIPAISYTGSYFDLVNNGLRSYVEALNDADVVLVDLAQYGHTGEYLAYNAGHLTAYGYYVMACDYISAISFIMKTHNMDYRFIQFIGTDHALT